MENHRIKVELFTIPQAACDAGKANWTQTGEMVKRQVLSRFGDSILFKHIEFMSEQWFENQKAQEALENGALNFPFVLVNGEIACADKKINISKINRAINELLTP